jgi:two-component system cell cycle sensor histidine kinase/response regulator CckA
MSDSRKLDPKIQRELSAYRAFLAQQGEGSSPEAPEPLDVAAIGERYRYVLENLRAMTIDVAADGRIVYASPSVTTVLGYDPEELIGTQGIELIHPDDLEELAATARRLRESRGPFRNIYRARHKQGHWVWMEASAVRTQSPHGPAFTVIFARDVGEMKRASEALIESEDRYRTLTEHASDIIAEVDSDGRIHYLSPSFETVLGREPEEILGKTLGDAVITDNLHPDDVADLVESYRRCLAAGDAVDVLLTYRFRHADGSWHWFESQTTPYRTRRGELRKVVVSRDMTDRIQAEAELRESEERYRLLAKTSRDMTTEEVLGHPPETLVGTTAFNLIHPDDMEHNIDVFLTALKNEEPVQGEPYRVRHRDGSWRWVEAVGVPYRRSDGELRFLSVSHDITRRRLAEEQRRKLEERMRQAQKLEGLGVMAGGIAHDFNNLLTPILGNASLALLELPASSPARERIEKIRKAALRAAALTNQMLTYAGVGPVVVEPIDLSRVVREMAQLLESSISGQSTVVYRLDANLPLIEADDAQLSQVVMNLLTNAVEAVGEGEGRIAIATGTAQVDAASGLQTPFGEDLPEGTYAYLEVSDTGCGMDDETRSRIFDPFFTTKFAGRGLGLAAVLGIVRGHRGSIEIESEPDRGTRFRVLFPSARAQRAADVPESVAEREWRGSGTILVVDDDEGVRELAEETLKRAGLSVLCASDGRTAVEVFHQHQDEIRAVLLDRTMPDISGEEAFDEIRRIRPDARIVLISGYSQERAMQDFANKDLAGFLQKPFLPQTLIEKIRAVFGE